MLLALAIIAAILAAGFGIWQMVSALKTKKNFDEAHIAFNKQLPVLQYLNSFPGVKSDLKIKIMEKLHLNIGVMKKVVAILEENGMITTTDQELFLTDFGRKYVEVFGKKKDGKD